MASTRAHGGPGRARRKLGRDAGGARSPEPDRSVPGLVVKIGNYPLHHGGVGAIRSLGRLGVPMYAITEDRWTPAARSRYLREAFVWPTTGREPAERLLAGLLATARRLGGPAVLIPTDEEAAVLIAEHQRELSAHFLFPPVPPKLPRRLASKQGLHELCTEHGIATPVSVSPRTYAEVEWFAARARFPMVAKNREAFVRRARPAVGGTTRVSSARELLAMARGWGTVPVCSSRSTCRWRRRRTGSCTATSARRASRVRCSPA